MPQKYTNFLKVRITDLEKKTFLLLSETAGISVSELIRKRINNIKIVSKSGINMLNELRRQGGLLKQGMGIIKTADIAQDEKDKLILSLHKTVQEIQVLIQKMDTIFTANFTAQDEVKHDS